MTFILILPTKIIKRKLNWLKYNPLGFDWSYWFGPGIVLLLKVKPSLTNFMSALSFEFKCWRESSRDAWRSSLLGVLPSQVIFSTSFCSVFASNTQVPITQTKHQYQLCKTRQTTLKQMKIKHFRWWILHVIKLPYTWTVACPEST